MPNLEPKIYPYGSRQKRMENFNALVEFLKKWKENNKGKDTIAYSFGYESDDILEMEFEFDADDFDASKLTLSIENNEFFPNKYIVDLKYDEMDCDWEDVDDFEGEYYNTEYYESK